MCGKEGQLCLGEEVLTLKMHLMNVYWSNSHREASEIFIRTYLFLMGLCGVGGGLFAAHFQATLLYMKPNAGYP